MPTTPTPTDADRIAAAGVALALADGSAVRVRFDLATLHRVEAEHGTIAPFTAQLVRIQQGSLGDGPWIADLRSVLALLFPDVPTDAFSDPPHVIAAAIFMAWLEAFPAPDPKA